MLEFIWKIVPYILYYMGIILPVIYILELYFIAYAVTIVPIACNLL